MGRNPQAEAQDVKTLEQDPSSFIGMTLQELFAQWGAPQAVYAVRGRETWQDDVAFAYKDFDCYIIKDRIWQIAVREAFGVRTGDTRADAKKAFGEKDASGRSAEFDTFILFSLPSKSWGIALRINFDQAGEGGRVQAIFIYRTDI